MKATSVVSCAALALACACTSTEMYRDRIKRSDADGCVYSETGGPVDDNCKRYSIEHHPLGGPNDDEYLVGVVEFDDQGWFQHAGQMDFLMEELEREASQHDVIISVFVHGWKHNAEFCDPNLCCFRTLMAQLARSESEYARTRGRPRRSVVGVYVGWRGLSVKGPDFLRSTSFWDRKGTATQVALGSVRELFARLKTFQENHNDPTWVGTHVKGGQERSGALRNRLFILGHSFGGAIVYTSVAQYLMNSATSARADEERSPVKGFGDLVMLVNPAFEAARYEPLHHIAQTRKYPPNQEPVFIAVTSIDDTATGKAFPIGRWLNGRLEEYTSTPGDVPGDKSLYQRHTKGEERDANIQTIGHSDRYVSHLLRSTKGPLAPPIPPTSPDCGCPYAGELENSSKADLSREVELAGDFVRNNVTAGYRKRGWIRDYAGGISLEHKTFPPPVPGAPDPTAPEPAPDSPFWVVQTNVPIVVGHNEFWTSYLINFVRQVYDDILAKHDEVKPVGKPTMKD
ncbi:MAG: hypothetical protein ACXWF2_07900 [Usitatibacter sp.]